MLILFGITHNVCVGKKSTIQNNYLMYYPFEKKGKGGEWREGKERQETNEICQTLTVRLLELCWLCCSLYFHTVSTFSTRCKVGFTSKEMKNLVSEVLSVKWDNMDVSIRKNTTNF